MSERLANLHAAGVSIWLDDLSRERLATGNLASLISEKSVTGVTTNPTIFAGALSAGARYADQIAELASDNSSVADAITALTTDDVREACDLFEDIYHDTNLVDGRVSIEVEPGLAHDTEATIAQARELYARVKRPNVMIKIPATEAGLPAITAVLAEGISVNVTLIFSPDRYRAVLDAWLTGLEEAAAGGRDLTSIGSVGSFFVSRIDTEVDARLTAIGTDEALALRGKFAIANARLAHQVFSEVMASERWAALAARGAQAQRPLWASTGVKNPDYPDTLYVDELVVANSVNTMPEKTLLAVADHGSAEDRVTGSYAEAAEIRRQVEAAGVDLDDVFKVLESEGVQKFVDSWDELVETVRTALGQA